MYSANITIGPEIWFEGYEHIVLILFHCIFVIRTVIMSGTDRIQLREDRHVLVSAHSKSLIDAILNQGKTRFRLDRYLVILYDDKDSSSADSPTEPLSPAGSQTAVCPPSESESQTQIDTAPKGTPIGIPLKYLHATEHDYLRPPESELSEKVQLPTIAQKIESPIKPEPPSPPTPPEPEPYWAQPRQVLNYKIENVVITPPQSQWSTSPEASQAFGINLHPDSQSTPHLYPTPPFARYIPEEHHPQHLPPPPEVEADQKSSTDPIGSDKFHTPENKIFKRH